MPSITRRRYRLAADILSQDAPRSAVTGAPLKLILANDTAIEIAAFDGDPSQSANLVDDTTNWAQVIVQLYAPGPDQGPPAIDAVPVASKIVTTFSATTWEQWRDGTYQHAIATFTATEMNLGAHLVDGHLWLVVTLVTTDTPARAVTLAKGRIPVTPSPARHLSTARPCPTSPSPRPPSPEAPTASASPATAPTRSSSNSRTRTTANSAPCSPSPGSSPSAPPKINRPRGHVVKK